MMRPRPLGNAVWLLVASVFLGLLGGLAGGWLFSPPARAFAQQSAQVPAQVLTAREFRLVDEKGLTWARLGASLKAEQHRGLILNDQQGRERLRLAVSPEGNGGLVLSDAGGRFRAALTVSSTGIPGLALTDLQGGMRYLLLVERQGSPQQDFYDGQGRISLGLQVSAQGSPELRMSRQAPDFGAARLGASSLAFQGEGFRDALQLGADSEKGGLIRLFDGQGELKSTLPADSQPGSR